MGGFDHRTQMTVLIHRHQSWGHGTCNSVGNAQLMMMMSALDDKTANSALFLDDDDDYSGILIQHVSRVSTIGHLKQRPKQAYR
jgi:hypothetical protein